MAWLIGGGQDSITASRPSDAYAAMSVVSDSNGTGGPGSVLLQDIVVAIRVAAIVRRAHVVTEFVRERFVPADITTIREEYGRYPYSFGYKSASGTGNFYPVMAYGDSGQTRYRLFSNPRITYCSGFACGVAAQADNARSLMQTIPMIASFRAASVTPEQGGLPTIWQCGRQDGCAVGSASQPDRSPIGS